MTGIGCDTHIHSEYSTDSQTPMEAQIQQALRLGLSEICFTDHMDYDFPEEAMNPPCEKPPFVFDITDYQRKIESLRQVYPEITIGTGVECGLQNTQETIEKNRQLTKGNNWDYIIGSLHLVRKTDPYYPAFWEGKKAENCVRLYLEELLDNITAFSDFDSLGHLDYVVRYAPDSFVYRLEEYFEIIEEILALLIRKDIALEINTSGLKSSDMPNPHLSVLTRYVQMGGELVTIGSDAHTPNYLGYQFERLPEWIKKAGLRQYVTYRARKPIFHSI
ncbi:MAG: histidinol-phosphatase HisJ family protein [Lachnospiraceae bacterium]|nr:histidinol-phosphatase HisJ family protein [Lachnospiraceae bacterium]